MQDVVFTIEEGRVYFAKEHKVPTRAVRPGCADVPTCGAWFQMVSGQGSRGYRLCYGNHGSSQWPKCCR